MLRAIDSVGESLRKRIQSNSSVSQEPIVKANIAIEVKKVNASQGVKFPDKNINASGDASWLAKTSSNIDLPSGAFAGNKCIVFLDMYIIIDYKKELYMELNHMT